MKWLQIQALSRVNSYLENLQLPASGIVIDGRIEAFSRKLVRSDKALLSALKRQYSGDTGDQSHTGSGNSSPRTASHKSAKTDVNQTPSSQAQQRQRQRSVSDGPGDTPNPDSASVSSRKGPDTPPVLSLPSRTTSAPTRTNLQPRGISFGRSLFGTKSSAVDTSTLEDDPEPEESTDSSPLSAKRRSRKDSRSSDRRNSHSRRERSRSPIGHGRSISAPASSTTSLPGSRGGTPPPGSPYLPASPFLKAQQLSDNEVSHTPIGDLHQMRTIKVFADLIECMNSFHEDHDFRYVSPMHFQHDLTIGAAQHAINSWLAPIEREYPTFSTDLWRAVDSAIGLGECEVYAFDPSDGNDNPFLDNALWAFNYFFVNRKQVLYFKCVGKRIGSSPEDDDGDEEMT